MQTSPPVPGGATHTHPLWNQDSYLTSFKYFEWFGSCYWTKRKADYVFIYFSVFFYHFIIKKWVLEHWSKRHFKIPSLFLNLGPARRTSGLEFACWWHFQFTQPVFVFLSRLSLCKCELASKLKMAQPVFKLLHLSILHKIHYTCLQCWTNIINRWVSVPGQYWNCGPALSIMSCSP